MRALILALLGICCLAAYTVEGVGSEVLRRQICVGLSTKQLPIKRIRTYTISEGPLKAVIFVTKRGLKICADPNHDWVKDAMKNVDKTAKKSLMRTLMTTVQQGTSVASDAAVTLTG